MLRISTTIVVLFAGKVLSVCLIAGNWVLDYLLERKLYLATGISTTILVVQEVGRIGISTQLASPVLSGSPVNFPVDAFNYAEIML